MKNLNMTSTICKYKTRTISKIILIFGLLCSGSQLALANMRISGVNGQVIYCTTLYKGGAELGKPLLPGGPLEQLASLPTICAANGTNLGHQEGVRGLMASGWLAVSVSHNVAVLSVAKEPGDKAEILVTVLYILQKTNSLVTR